MACFAPKIGRPCEQFILPAKKRTRSQFSLFFQVSFQSKYAFSQTGKNGLGFRASYHVRILSARRQVKTRSHPDFLAHGEPACSIVRNPHGLGSPSCIHRTSGRNFDKYCGGGWLVQGSAGSVYIDHSRQHSAFLRHRVSSTTTNQSSSYSQQDQR